MASTSTRDGVDEIIEWLDTLQLHKRKLNFLKNIPASIADGVLVAEIIHKVFPKIIQIHNYNETNSIQGRKLNWTLLNKKVLKLIHCDVKEEDIDSFASRRSSTLAIDFLRLLKVRLLAYEPLYLTGQYSVDPVSQARLTSQLSTSQIRPPTHESDFPLPPPPSKKLSSSQQSLSSSTSSSTTTQPSSTSPVKEASRRPSMLKSQQILKNKQAIHEKASRRASTMSSNEMDLLYQEFSTKLKKSTQELAKDSDEKDRYSALIDARMAALREQNKEELQKIDKRLTQSKQELTEIEQGKEIIGVDETVLDHLAIDQKSSDLKTQLNQQFHRASIVIGTSDSFWYQKSDHNYIRSNSSTSQQAVDSPATSRKKLAGSSQHSLESVSPPPQHGDSSSSPSYSTPIRKSSKLFESVRENESEEMNDPHEDDYDEDEEQDTYSNDISPLTYQSNMRGLESIPSPQRLNFRLNSMAEEQNDDDEEGNESDESDVPPPPPRVEIMPKVDYIRGYSQEHGRYFYIKLDHADPIDPSHGQSQWEAPTEGIVQCRDDSTGRDYFTHVDTGKSAWILSELFQ